MESKKRKVLFLDVDGVLNNGIWASKMFEQGIRVYDDHLLEENALRLLQRIIYATGARIVVSSSWRHDRKAYHKLEQQLFRYGLRVLCKTQGTDTDRGRDIGLYLEQHPDVEKFAILDDDPDVGNYADHLVQTDPDKGLTGAEAFCCIRLLNQGEMECEIPLPAVLPSVEEYYAETAIYIRTVDRIDKAPEKGSWRLPDGIDAEVEMERLLSYAQNHGYGNPTIYLDNGYTGSGTVDAANLLLHRRAMAGYVGTVIISAPHQIEGGMNILMMTERTFRKNGVEFIIAGHNQDAGTVIHNNYDAWVWEDLEQGMNSLKNEKGIPAEEAFRQLREDLDEKQQLYRQDLDAAQYMPPKYTKSGHRLIDADEALWLLKEQYGEQSV